MLLSSKRDDAVNPFRSEARLPTYLDLFAVLCSLGFIGKATIYCRNLACKRLTYFLVSASSLRGVCVCFVHVCVCICFHPCQVIMWKYESWASVLRAIMGQPEPGDVEGGGADCRAGGGFMPGCGREQRV